MEHVTSQPQPKPRTTLGGRTFKVVENSTAECQVFIRGQLSRSGLSRLTMYADESATDFAFRVLDALTTDADVFLLLGGILLPAEMEAVDWSPQVAIDTGNFLRKLTDPEDTKAIYTQIGSVIQAFTRAGLISVLRTRRSSETPQESPVSPTLPTELANLSRNGPASSAPSPDSTRTANA